MLADSRVITTIAVHDIENALYFYGEVLGLVRVEENDAGYVYDSGGGRIGLHQSATAGSGQATCAWWTVDDVEATVAYLKKRGVVFNQNYDLPHVKTKGGVYYMHNGDKAAWFSDPDGNILGFGNF